jgi:hypothetical protein
VENHKQFDIVCAGIATWDTLFSGIDRDLMSIDGILSKGYTASSGGDAVNAAISTSRLGLRTAVCASLGKDSAAQMVIDELEKSEHYRLALHYSRYRMQRSLLRQRNTTDKKVLALLRHDSEVAKQENANKDPIINSTMRDYLASEVSEDICRRYIFPEDVIHAHDEGMIHIHDRQAG